MQLRCHRLIYAACEGYLWRALGHNHKELDYKQKDKLEVEEAARVEATGGDAKAKGMWDRDSGDSCHSAHNSKRQIGE